MSFYNLFKLNNKINIKNRTSNKVLKILLLVVPTLLVTIGYSTISSVLSTNADVVVYPVAMMRTSSSGDSYAYKNTTYSDNIKTLTFEREIDIPSEALASWDVSANSDESVMAYVVTNSEDDTKYDLYIEADGDVYANYNSSYLFANLKGLEIINNIDYLNISKVTNMSYMFYYVGYNATTFEIDLSNWNTSKVTNMSFMFEWAGYNATTWDIGDLSSWGTSNVTNMSNMFSNAGYNAIAWDIGDLSSWNTSSVTNMSRMFYNAGYSTTIWDIGDLSSWNTSSVANMYYMFYNAGFKATTWNIGDLSSWNTSQVMNMSRMFNCAGYNATTWNIGNLGDWNTTNVTNMSSMFNHAGYNATTWYIGDLSGWNTSSVIDMSWLFSYLGENAAIWDIGDISNWNTLNVTNMKGIFAGIPAAANISITNWNTSSVTNMASMFFGSELSSSDLNNIILYLNTSNVTDMSGMFNSISVNSLDLNGLDVSKVTDMSGMFSGCSNLTQIDVSSWYTDNLVKTYGYMYYDANLSWERGMFQNCPNLTTIYVGDGWDMSNVTDSTNMFKNSTHLVGGNGTTYDANHIDKEYARVDGNGGPGYLTYKGEEAIQLSIPSSPSPKAYTGSSISSGITCPTGSTASGTTQALNAGTYVQTCTLNDINVYNWSDGSTGPKNITWEITSPLTSCSIALTDHYNGTLVVTPNYSSTGITYAWSNGGNAQTINVNSAATYTANVSYGRTVSCSITVRQRMEYYKRMCNVCHYEYVCPDGYYGPVGSACYYNHWSNWTNEIDCDEAGGLFVNGKCYGNRSNANKSYNCPSLGCETWGNYAWSDTDCSSAQANTCQYNNTRNYFY